MELSENEIAKIIVDSAYNIHKNLGPGLLEGVYQRILTNELRKRGLRVHEEVAIPLIYEDLEIEIAFRADMIVNEKVLIELKSLEHILPVHKKQVLTYLKLSGKKLGLLINFGSEYFKSSITRIVNNLEEQSL